MKVLLLAGMLLMLAIGCAHSAPVTFDMIVPLYNASLTAACTEAVGDTCKDLSQGLIYRRLQSAPATDSTFVVALNLVGMSGKPTVFTVEQPEGTYVYWSILVDVGGNTSCRGNFASKTIVLRPAPATITPR